MERKHYLNALFLALALMGCPIAAQRAGAEALSVAQTVTAKLKGKVIDAHTGEPLIGAYITVEGTKRMAVTDIDGAFAIEATPGERPTPRHPT